MFENGSRILVISHNLASNTQYEVRFPVFVFTVWQILMEQHHCRSVTSKPICYTAKIDQKLSILNGGTRDNELANL
jgi:hypothetical protein